MSPLSYSYTYKAMLMNDKCSDRSLSLTPLVHTPEFHFEQSNSWMLPGAHGEVVRSVLFDSEVSTIFTNYFFYFLYTNFYSHGRSIHVVKTAM